MTRYDDIPLYGETRRRGPRYDRMNRSRDPYTDFTTRRPPPSRDPMFKAGPAMTNVEVEQLHPFTDGDVRMCITLSFRSEGGPEDRADKMWIVNRVAQLLKDRYGELVSHGLIARNLSWARDYDNKYWEVEYRHVYYPQYRSSRPDRKHVHYEERSYAVSSEEAVDYAARSIREKLRRDHYLNMDYDWVRDQLVCSRVKYEPGWVVIFDRYFAQAENTWYPFHTEVEREQFMTKQLSVVKIDGFPVGWADVDNARGGQPIKVKEILIHQDHVGPSNGIMFGTTDRDPNGPREPRAGFYRLRDGDQEIRYVRSRGGRWSWHTVSGASNDTTWEAVADALRRNNNALVPA